MYEALDSFVRVESWTSFHWADRDRFFVALEKIVRDPAFSPPKVGDYITEQYRKQYGRNTNPEERDRLRKHYTDAADTIWRYLKATGQC